jgi:Tfp pilus assembly major pilin PilA
MADGVTEEKIERVRELAKAAEKEKMKIAYQDIKSIQSNHESIHKILQVQLTQNLMDVSNIQTEIETEILQYWLKELPISKSIANYFRAIANLVNLTTQLEDLFKRTFEEMINQVEFPSFERIEESYKEQMAELINQIEEGKKEFEKYKIDLSEKFDVEKNIAVKKEAMRVHNDWESEATNIELKMSEKDKIIDDLTRQLFLTETKTTDKKDTVIISPMPTMRGVEVIEPMKPGLQPLPGFKKGDVERELQKRFLELIGEHSDYKRMRLVLSREYSTASFYKYLDKLLESGYYEKVKEDGVWILRTTGKVKQKEV